MGSKIVVVACAAVAAVALVGQEDADGGSESGVMVTKVVIAASAAVAVDALVGCLFALLSSSGSAYEFETREEDHADKFTGWCFPPHGWIECNVDGSAPPVKDIAGCGGVFRDATGCWVYGFARRLETCTSSAAELEAISTALDIALVRGYRKLILETDSLTAADVVNRKNGASARRSPHEKKLVQSIRNKLENRRWEIKIVHCNGEANKVADWLANLSHGLQVGDQIELPTLPDGCRSCQKLMLEDARLAETKAWREIR